MSHDGGKCQQCGITQRAHTMVASDRLNKQRQQTWQKGRFKVRLSPVMLNSAATSGTVPSWCALYTAKPITWGVSVCLVDGWYPHLRCNRHRVSKTDWIGASSLYTAQPRCVASQAANVHACGYGKKSIFFNDFDNKGDISTKP